MTVLVVGASGATGRLVVEQLLRRGKSLRIVVRTNSNLGRELFIHPQLTIIQGSLLEFSEAELAALVEGCTAVVSCLGHNLSVKGIFGAPRALVTEATAKLCKAIISHQRPTAVKFILMNSSGVRNLDSDEPVSTAQHIILFALRHLLPPHRDNERAAAYLSSQVGENDEHLEWVSVRPDSLVDLPQESPYSMHPSPLRSAIFDAGICSRINVACVIRDLICTDDLWSQWQGRMPILYNSEQ